MSSTVTSDVLVGRRRELDQLLGWLDQARSGTGRLVACVGEPGIGKTRLAQELAGVALAQGVAVAWGRASEIMGAPALWPWRQILRSLGVEAEAVVAGPVETIEDRFRRFDAVAAAVRDAAGARGLLVVFDDVHWADEPSLHVLRHLAGELLGSSILLVATARPPGRSGDVAALLTDLLRFPNAHRLELAPFGLAEVELQLAAVAADPPTGNPRPDPGTVLRLTGGNPLFVREMARAVADGTWRPDRPPATVLDIVRARLGGVSAECRRLVQAGSVVGRDFSLAVAAAALGEPVTTCLEAVEEATEHALLQHAGSAGTYSFVHALTRDAVEASLAAAERADLHRRIALALEATYASDLSAYAGQIAGHWLAVSSYGEGANARRWAQRAGEEAVRRLAHDDAVALYRAALAIDQPALEDGERAQLLLGLAGSAHLAGDLAKAVEAATEAAAMARAAKSPLLLAQAALMVQAVPDPALHAIARGLTEDAFGSLGGDADPALRARLLAQRSHFAYYDGDQPTADALSGEALDLARRSGDDRALIDALHARKEARPGPLQREDRVGIVAELNAAARRAGDARAAMWASAWRIDTLLEAGQVGATTDELAVLGSTVAKVGGPASAWLLDRVTACVAQAQGRFADATAAARRAYEAMRDSEPLPATGAYLAQRCALTFHVSVSEDDVALACRSFECPPRFRTMQLLCRALLLERAGRLDEAGAWYQQAGPVSGWSLPVFFVLPGLASGAIVAMALRRGDDLEQILAELQPYAGCHVTGEGVAYLGPATLILGRIAAALDRTDRAVGWLSAAVEQADLGRAPGFAAEARVHLATVLAARGASGDAERAAALAGDAARVIRTLGMSRYVDDVAGLLARLQATDDGSVLSARELEVAELVAEGLTSRQIAERLYISERTAQNHVHHIMTKLGFTGRSQIAAWVAARRR